MYMWLCSLDWEYDAGFWGWQKWQRRVPNSFLLCAIFFRVRIVCTFFQELKHVGKAYINWDDWAIPASNQVTIYGSTFDQDVPLCSCPPSCEIALPLLYENDAILLMNHFACSVSLIYEMLDIFFHDTALEFDIICRSNPRAKNYNNFAINKVLLFFSTYVLISCVTRYCLCLLNYNESSTLLSGFLYPP